MIPKLPLPSHVSAATRALNPHVYQQGASVGDTRAALVCAGKAAAPEPKHAKFEQKSKTPNKTEQRYLDILEAKKRRGEINSYRYEGMSLRWGDGMRYTADVVVFCGKEITLIEVKGPHIHQKDLIRFKGCKAEWKEFNFELWQEVKREWKRIL